MLDRGMVTGLPNSPMTGILISMAENHTSFPRRNGRVIEALSRLAQRITALSQHQRWCSAGIISGPGPIENVRSLFPALRQTHLARNLNDAIAGSGPDLARCGSGD